MSFRPNSLSVGDGTQLWGERYTRPAADLPMLPDVIARDLAQQLSFRLTGHGAKPASDAEAYMLYLKGRFYWNQYTQPGFEKSIEYFNAALRRDPTYALAYSGLADTYAILAGEGFVAPKR